MITETRNIQQSSMMLFHTDGKCLKPHLRTLRLLGFTLLLTYFCRGQSQLIGSPIIATLGNDIILPCQLEPVEDATDLTLEWTRSDLDPRFVHVWRSGKELVSKKHKSFEGRTSLFLDELMFGNISLKLSKVKLADRGTYRCFIPALDRQSFVQLDVGAVSSPVISLAGTDKGGAVLQCQCKDWYPEPEVLWLDSEGNLLSAGPTGTVRGPDDLYTVSSRVTVEKRPSNSFTCRVQQKNINQTRETAILILDDFFELQSSYSSTITGLAVSLAVFVILFILLLLFSVWKWRKNKTKTERSAMSETVKGEEKKRTEDQFVTEEEMKPLKGNGENKSKRDKAAQSTSLSAREKKQQKKKEAEKQDQTKKLNDKNKEKVQDHKSSQSKSQDYSLTSPASQDSATGRVIVDEVDLKGTYARLINTSNQDQPMGGWELHVHVNNKKPIKYTFEQKFKLKARKTVTIWAGESDVKQDTANLVGFSKTYWGTGEELVVYLYSKTGELEARKMMQLGNSQKYQENDTCVTSLDSDKGHIVVNEVDPEGKYVRLYNKSKTDQEMKNCELYLHVNNKKPIIYTFRNSLKLKAGETVKIWASGCGVNNDTSTDLVWKDQTSWGTGEQLLFSLYSHNGEEMATKKVDGKMNSDLQT